MFTLTTPRGTPRNPRNPEEPRNPLYLFAFHDADPDAVHGGNGLLNVKLTDPFAVFDEVNVPLRLYASTPEPLSENEFPFSGRGGLKLIVVSPSTVQLPVP